VNENLKKMSTMEKLALGKRLYEAYEDDFQESTMAEVAEGTGLDEDGCFRVMVLYQALAL
jgi:hypothetical protein